MPKPQIISTERAEIVALWCETLLYGVFLVLFQKAVRLIAGRRTDRRTRGLTLVAAFSILAFISAHNFIVFSRVIQAFTTYQNAKGGPAAYFYDLRRALEVSQASCQIVVTFLGDCVALYRVWVVYEGYWLAMLLPYLSLAGTTAASIGSVIVIGQASQENTPFYLPRLKKWLLAYFSMTFATSVLCTLMIACKLAFVQHRLRSNRVWTSNNKVVTIMRIIIESSALYSTSMLLYLTSYLLESNYSIIFGDWVSPIVGISFSLITIRVHDTFKEDKKPVTSNVDLSFWRATRPTATGTGGSSVTDQRLRSFDGSSDMRTLEAGIRVTTTCQSDKGLDVLPPAHVSL